MQSLQLIHDYISDEAKAKASLLGTGATHFAMKNAYETIFKNCSSESSLVVFVHYSGPCQPNHDRFGRHLPRLLDPSADSSSFSREKFLQRSLQQLDLINTRYDDNVHGKIRAVISYGTLYVANCGTQEPLPVSEFDALFDVGASNPEAANSDPVHPRGRGRGRGRRPRGRGLGRSVVPWQTDNRPRTSFIPTGNPYMDNRQLQMFLSNYGFALAEETVDYRVSLKLSIAGQVLKWEAVVVLDENFNLKYVNMPDMKWFCVNIVSANKDSRYRPHDCRFKIQSRAKRTVLQLRQNSDDFADIIAKHRTMLQHTGNDMYGVHPDFLSRIRFARKKHTRVYRLAANQYAATTDDFLYGMAIKINYGTEYSRPSPDGTFQTVDRNRVEVTAIPEMPDLRDEDKMRTFFNRTWDFAEELGSILE